MVRASDGPVQPSANGFLIGSLLAILRNHVAARVLHDLHRAGFTDLRPAHLPVFMYLPTRGGRLTVLAEAASMTKQSMGYLVEALEQMGYVHRGPHDHDGRMRLITRTARGWDVNAVAKLTVRTVESEWSQLLGVRRMTELKRSLGQVAAQIGASYRGSVSEATARVIALGRQEDIDAPTGQ